MRLKNANGMQYNKFNESIQNMVQNFTSLGQLFGQPAKTVQLEDNYTEINAQVFCSRASNCFH